MDIFVEHATGLLTNGLADSFYYKNLVCLSISPLKARSINTTQLYYEIVYLSLVRLSRKKSVSRELICFLMR